MLFFAIMIFVVSFCFTYILVPYVCRWAHKKNILDVPDGLIKNHNQATPYLGGVAVYCGFLISLILFLPFEEHLPFLVFGLTMLLVLGLVDDFFRISPGQKFIGQMVAAASFLGAGLCLKEAFLSSFVNLFLSFFWILTVDNAFNLVDVMDGLATSLAIFSTTSFLVFAYLFNLPSVLFLLAAFLGPLVAFLFYNKPPAKIYLGDAGALFIGGFLAVVPFLFNWGYHSAHGFLVPPVILAIPLLEVVSLVIIRTYKGIPFYYGSPDHFSLCLLSKGWTKKGVLLVLCFVSLQLFVLGYFVAFGILSFWSSTAITLLGSVIWSVFVFRAHPRFLRI